MGASSLTEVKWETVLSDRGQMWDWPLWQRSNVWLTSLTEVKWETDLSDRGQMRDWPLWQRSNERLTSLTEVKWATDLSDRGQLRDWPLWQKSNERLTSLTEVNWETDLSDRGQMWNWPLWERSNVWLTSPRSVSVSPVSRNLSSPSTAPSRFSRVTCICKVCNNRRHTFPEGEYWSKPFYLASMLRRKYIAIKVQKSIKILQEIVFKLLFLEASLSSCIFHGSRPYIYTMLCCANLVTCIIHNFWCIYLKSLDQDIFKCASNLSTPRMTLGF